MLGAARAGRRLEGRWGRQLWPRCGRDAAEVALRCGKGGAEVGLRWGLRWR